MVAGQLCSGFAQAQYTSQWIPQWEKLVAARGVDMQWVMRGFSFDGRIRASEYVGYWLFTVGFQIGAVMLFGASLALGDVIGIAVGVLLILPVYLGATWISLAATVKRFRDANLSPWVWLLLVLGPLGGFVLFFIALFSATDKGPLVDTFDPSRKPELPSWLNKKGDAGRTER
jgi:uncharacterized membrane protein YhaH (DUF805 family)